MTGPDTRSTVVRQTVTPDAIICLEDGRRFKSLKRHLRTHYNLSPDEYRQKWDLPSDYPMVAPNYAQRRADLARQIVPRRSSKVVVSMTNALQVVRDMPCIDRGEGAYGEGLADGYSRALRDVEKALRAASEAAQ